MRIIFTISVSGTMVVVAISDFALAVGWVLIFFVDSFYFYCPVGRVLIF